MSEQKNGGPAFPLAWTETNEHGIAFPFVQAGMTLRDASALAALPAIIAATSAGQHMPQIREGDKHIRFAIARDAYDMADAMLAVRAEG